MSSTTWKIEHINLLGTFPHYRTVTKIINWSWLRAMSLSTACVLSIVAYEMNSYKTNHCCVSWCEYYVFADVMNHKYCISRTLTIRIKADETKSPTSLVFDMGYRPVQLPLKWLVICILRFIKSQPEFCKIALLLPTMFSSSGYAQFARDFTFKQN